MLYQYLLLPVAFPALPSTVAIVHSSLFCTSYWILSFVFTVFLIFCTFCVVSSLSRLATGTSSVIVWVSVFSLSSFFLSCLSSILCSVFSHSHPSNSFSLSAVCLEKLAQIHFCVEQTLSFHLEIRLSLVQATALFLHVYKRLSRYFQIFALKP